MGDGGGGGGGGCVDEGGGGITALLPSCRPALACSPSSPATRSRYPLRDTAKSIPIEFYLLILATLAGVCNRPRRCYTHRATVASHRWEEGGMRHSSDMGGGGGGNEAL